MIARTGAIIVCIIVLSFIVALLLVDLTTKEGFTSGESLASFFNFLTSPNSEKCECEYSSQLQEYICNPFCGNLAGKECKERTDCL